MKPAILGLEVTTTYREILPNVAISDVITSVQPLGARNEKGHGQEFRQVQELMTYRFLFTGPPGVAARKWVIMEPLVSRSDRVPLAVPTARRPAGSPLRPKGPDPDGF